MSYQKRLCAVVFALTLGFPFPTFAEKTLWKQCLSALSFVARVRHVKVRGEISELHVQLGQVNRKLDDLENRTFESDVRATASQALRGTPDTHYDSYERHSIITMEKFLESPLFAGPIEFDPEYQRLVQSLKTALHAKWSNHYAYEFNEIDIFSTKHVARYYGASDPDPIPAMQRRRQELYDAQETLDAQEKAARTQFVDYVTGHFHFVDSFAGWRFERDSELIAQRVTLTEQKRRLGNQIRELRRSLPEN